MKALMSGMVIVGLTLVLAACETTGEGDFSARPSQGAGGFQSGVTTETRYNSAGSVTTQSQLDPATGQRIVTGGSFVIGAGSPAATGSMVGNWSLSDDFARTCGLGFGLTLLGTSNGAMVARPSGFCNPEFSAVSGWMNVGQTVMLTNASGTVLAQLSPDGSGNYSGSFNGTFGASPVTLKRGMF